MARIHQMDAHSHTSRSNDTRKPDLHRTQSSNRPRPPLH
jgi:hypothetical protein